MSKLLYSIIAIILAITLSAYRSTNTDTRKLIKDSTVTYKLQIKSQPISVIPAISFDQGLQNQIRSSLCLIDSINKLKLGILQETDKMMGRIDPSVTEKVIGYFGYNEQDIIAKCRSDTIIRNITYWIILLMFIIHLYYLTQSSTLRKEDEWKSSLIHFIIMIGSYPLIYFCLYGLLSGLFNSDYLTLKEILNNFK